MFNSNRKLKWNERRAFNLLCKMKFNDLCMYRKCRYNDAILRITKLLLFGRDPIDFLIDLLELDEEDVRNCGLRNL